MSLHIGKFLKKTFSFTPASQRTFILGVWRSLSLGNARAKVNLLDLDAQPEAILLLHIVCEFWFVNFTPTHTYGSGPRQDVKQKVFHITSHNSIERASMWREMEREDKIYKTYFSHRFQMRISFRLWRKINQNDTINAPRDQQHIHSLFFRPAMIKVAQFREYKN